MERWQGYLPAASASLLSTFQKAARGGVQFSQAERAVFMVCEFWTAISARKLAVHLGAQPTESLRYLSILYSAIGAHAVARQMIVAVTELEGTAHPQTAHQCLAALQERLLGIGDPVDQLIARLAQSLGLGVRAVFATAPTHRMGLEQATGL